MARDIKELEARIGYTFGDGALLLRALTHTSYVNEQKGGRIASNERLEFLGDSVLSLVVCRYLFEAYPTLPEGRLTVLRKNVVCQKALADYATKIGLGAYLLLGRGEERDGREKPKLLEDAFEALLGAMYLDCGSLERISAFVLPFVKGELAKNERELQPLEDYKTLLQQYVQQMPGEELRYETILEQGPDNAKTFTVRVLINSNDFGTGVGSSKKEAEQRAAAEALKRYLPAKD
ncbi:MAG: ribonuclease III [Ruminococcaceae bacterium]|nr:ribonuclease III [Oscillospiraceae bacterium]